VNKTSSYIITIVIIIIILEGNKILIRKLQQLTKKVKEKIDSYNNHFNTSSVRKRLFAITSEGDDNDINDVPINSIDDKIEQDSVTELNEKVELTRKLRLATSIKYARSFINNENRNYAQTQNNSSSEQQLEKFHITEENDKIRFLR